MKVDMKSLGRLGRMGLRAMNQNLPALLGGAAIAGVLATAWTAFKAAPKVEKALEEAETRKALRREEAGENAEEPVAEVTDDTDLTPWETFTAVAPHIWKPVACGGFTIACIAGAQVLNMQRLTMLAGAYKLSEKKLKEYEAKARELLGEEKATELRDEVAKETRRSTSPDFRTAVLTGKGDDVFYDPFTDKYFYSSEATVRRAESVLNKTLLSGDTVWLNDLYHELGLGSIKMGDAFCWKAYESDNVHTIDIGLAPDMLEVDGQLRVVYVMDFDVGIDADNFHMVLH